MDTQKTTLMQLNANKDKRGEPCRGDAETWKAIAVALWGLLDDVDTAGDMFKPPINNFFKYVIGKSEERHKYIKSNGYTLILTEKCKITPK